jgi:endo-1,4-beta-xylanase
VGNDVRLSRRSFLTATAGVTGAAMLGGSVRAVGAAASSIPRTPLWRTAIRRGIVYGSSIATWQLDPEYSRLFAREAAILFTEDDLLWYRLKPTPDSDLDFTYGDQIVHFAEQNGQLVLGAHLVWDQGFGEGWTDDDVWGLSESEARTLLFGTERAVVRHYKGRIAAWIVANEVISPEGRHGFRTDVPWYNTIGPEYVAEAFHIAAEEDPAALRIINDFGYETVNRYGDEPADKWRATLRVIDSLLDAGAPVQALGIQAHLLARHFAERFHPGEYRRWLGEVRDRGLEILITEMDVLDDGLPAQPLVRDRMVADVYRRYLDAALEETDVIAVINFGLTDRYTWLEEDYPRDDGAHRRPLPFDRSLRPKQAYWGIDDRLEHAPRRRAFWHPPRQSA